MLATKRIEAAASDTAPSAMPLREAGEQIARARARERVMRERLQQLAQDDYRQGKRYQRQYLASFDVMLAALHKANQKKRRRIPDSELVALAVELNAWAGTDEVVRMWPKAKAGGYRAINSFGIRNAALQVLAYRAANPFINPHPSQYAAAGMGGVEVACRRILKLLRQGYTHVLVADVESNFNTMRREGVIRMIPLPTTLIEAVVLADGLNFTTNQRRCNSQAREGAIQRHATAPKPTIPATGLSQEDVPLDTLTVCARQRGSQRSSVDEALKKGRQGLPQGSACSSLFSAHLHAPIVRRLSELAPVVHFDDNYFIFAKSREELVPIAQTLRSEFNRHLAGPLLFSKCIIKAARYGFIGLGYQFKARGKWAWLRPSHDKLNDCNLKFLGMFDDVFCGNMTRQDVKRYINGWCAGHRLWPHWRLWRALLLGRLDQHFPAPTEVNG